ncbi:TniQ family protein (plasmid) [Rhizobium sp. CB3090]|uniref:TniQ family protein n=1 Tax=Rhizobium sp. CB3090 TaxID=3039156 RepID=UPI0024B1A47F|nr:TniQ family protein [Rhizobium sp. CB3090]WFU13005.1 TniQ family protein [Rhizobium sp. CB3090]WFU13324.1 TniQ family protein [Rhizobium sp. CB3090]
MRSIPLLPIAPRPYPDELISSWQARVACRYGCTPAEIELWLGHGDRPSMFASFELCDFRPDPLVIRLWARTARLKIADVEAMMLSRQVRSIDWYVSDHSQRGICSDCLDEDVSAGRDHYLRREWAHVEAAACGKHRRLLQDFCDRCFARGRFRFECSEEGARLVCGDCSTVVSGGQNKIEGGADLDFLLMLTAAVDAAIEGRKGSVALNEITAVIETLWSRSQANGKPFIAWLDLKLPFGRLPVFTARGNPVAGLSLPWRAATFVAAAQLLDLAQARRWLGPPPPFLRQAFADRKRNPLPQAIETLDADKILETAPKLKLRSDVEYQRLAEQILASHDWKAISETRGRLRDRKLGRLMNQALNSEAGKSEALRPAAP